MDIDSLVVIEEMPDWCRESHRAAGNWGTYPHNGATRRAVSEAEAEEIVASDESGYAHVVDGIDVGDYIDPRDMIA